MKVETLQRNAGRSDERVRQIETENHYVGKKSGDTNRKVSEIDMPKTVDTMKEQEHSIKNELYMSITLTAFFHKFGDLIIEKSIMLSSL